MSGAPWILQLGLTLMHFLWQGLLVACVLSLVMAAMQKQSAAARYRVRCLALLVMALCPVLTWSSLAPSAPLPHVHGGVAGPAGWDSAIRWEDRLVAWLVASWALGVLWFLARLLVGLREVRALGHCDGTPLPAAWQRALKEQCRRFGVEVQARLTRSALVAVPMVVGWLRPVVLLPARLVTGLTEDQVLALLAHELAHVRRHDALVNLCQTLMESLFFYHPAVWWLSRSIRVEREFCCDDMAVAAVGRALPYARALATLETIRGSELRLAPSSRGGALMLRVQRLVGDRRATDRGFLLRSLPGALGVLMMGALGASAWAGGANPADEGAGQKAPRRVIVTWQGDGKQAPDRWETVVVSDSGQEVCPECGQRRQAGAPNPALQGRVVDAEGEPFPNAVVRWVEEGDAATQEMDVLLQTEDAGEGRDLWVTRLATPRVRSSDVDGDGVLDLLVTGSGQEGDRWVWNVGGDRRQVRTDQEGRWVIDTRVAPQQEVWETTVRQEASPSHIRGPVVEWVERTRDVLVQGPKQDVAVDFTQPQVARVVDPLAQGVVEVGDEVIEYRVRKSPQGADGQWIAPVVVTRATRQQETEAPGRVDPRQTKTAVAAPAGPQTYEIELRGQVIVTPTQVQANEVTIRNVSTVVEPPVRIQEHQAQDIELRTQRLQLDLQARQTEDADGGILLEVVPVLDDSVPGKIRLDLTVPKVQQQDEKKASGGRRRISM